MQKLKNNFNIKKVSQIDAIIEDAEKRVRKIKNISKNEPLTGKENEFFNEIKKKFIEN